LSKKSLPPSESLDERTLYLSGHAFDILTEPCPYFQISDYLPTAFYEMLTSTFPDKQYFDFARADGNLLITDESAEGFLADRPAWQKLFDILASPSFFEDALSALGRTPFVRARGPAGLLPMKIQQPGERPGPFTREVAMHTKFSRFDPGTSLHAHTDQPSTVFTFLLYFPPPEWQPGYGGSTELYAPTNRKLLHNWSNNHLPLKAMESVVRSDYRPNTMFGFLKSTRSWHGVEPVSCPSGISRNALIVTYHLTEAMQRRFLFRGVNSFYRRVERPKFRKFGYLD
tara:strand:+ start:1879 stop:2733 length:855 start_codon:yes stop_codon:yes gene_type:complete